MWMHLLIYVCMRARHSEAEGGGTSKMHRNSPNQDVFPVKSDAKIYLFSLGPNRRAESAQAWRPSLYASICINSDTPQGSLLLMVLLSTQNQWH